MFRKMLLRLRSLLGLEEQNREFHWQSSWSSFLVEHVNFYRGLSEQDKTLFHQRIWLFLETTAVAAGQFPVTDEDRLLVAASAIIPVWSFPKWHYFNLKGVYLLPAAFNAEFECGKPDSTITGMVGTGPMGGKMALCKPAPQPFGGIPV